MMQAFFEGIKNILCTKCKLETTNVTIKKEIKKQGRENREELKEEKDIQPQRLENN